MKAFTFCLVFILIIPLVLTAQDRIFLKEGGIIVANVVEVGSEELVYIPFENQNEGKQVIPMSKIKSITYQNGYSEIIDTLLFESKKDMLITSTGDVYEGKILSVSPEEYIILLSQQGGEVVSKIPMKEVALVSYASSSDGLAPPEGFVRLNESNLPDAYTKGVNDARIYYNSKHFFWSVSGLSIISPVLGIAFGMVINSKPPKEKYILHPIPGMLDNPGYRDGFYKECHKINRRKILLGVLTGIGGVLVIEGGVAFFISVFL